METSQVQDHERQGRVIECVGQRARVLVEPASGCPRCAAGEGCGQGLIGAMRSESHPVAFWITIPREEQVAPGDTLMLTMAPSALLAGSALVYLLPLAGLLLGASMTEALGAGTEGVSVISGVAGLAGGLLLVRTWLTRAARRDRFEPVFLRTVPVSDIQVT